MGIVSKIVKLGITGLGVKEISDYAKEVREEGRDPWSPSTFFGHFGNKAKDTVTDLLKRHQSGMDNQPQKKNMGGMANARKKGMGLEMAEGGIALKLVPSDKKLNKSLLSSCSTIFFSKTGADTEFFSKNFSYSVLENFPSL